MTLVAIAIAACGPPKRIPAARFAPHADWTAQAYAWRDSAVPAGPLSRADRIEDIAFLEHVLDEAFADDGAMTRASRASLRENLRDIPIRGQTAATFCRALAIETRNAAIEVTLNGQSCYDERHVPDEPLLAIPTGKNYAWQLHDDDRSKVGVLAIARFASPADPGWAGFDKVLAALAEQDVVVVDMQDARGSDPRMALAIGRALGAESVRREYEVRPVARDNAFARVTRQNHAHRFPRAPPPRERALWMPLATTADYQRIAREHANVVRRRPVGQSFYVWGNGCESACQLLLQLGIHRNDTTLGATAVDNRLNGDELGLVRLPHSGIEVTFPTAAYGPYAHRLLGGYVAGAAKGALDRAHHVAASRVAFAKFADGPVPACDRIAVDPQAVRRKYSRSWCNGTGVVGATLMLQLDAERAREFLSSCTGATAQTAITHPVEHYTIATVSAPRDALDRIASAPFVLSVSASCDDDRAYPTAP